MLASLLIYGGGRAGVVNTSFAFKQLAEDAAPTPSTSPGNPNPYRFSVRRVEPAVLDLVADFEKHRDAKAWDKALATLGKLAESDTNGMIPQGENMLLPARLRIRQLVQTLPPEGLRAYRLFNDPRAKQLFEQAQAALTDPSAPAPGARTAPAGGEEVVLLEKVVAELFFTSYGDRAADQLGDAMYERGEFDRAARAWAMILNEYPDTRLSVARLRLKLAAALARAGRWDDFQPAADLARQSAGDAALTLGGKPTTAAEFLASLPKPPEGGRAAPVAQGLPDKIAFPDSDEPAWQFAYRGPAARQTLAQMLANAGNQGSVLVSIVPPSECDGKRVYVHWLGITSALDVETGKLLWSSHKHSILNDRWQQFLWQADPDLFFMAVTPDAVVAVGAEPERVGQGNEVGRLICRDPATGAQRWTTAGGTLDTLCATGRPAVAAGVVYAAFHSNQSTDMQLVAVDLNSGAILFQLPLGTAPALNNQWNGRNRPAPPSIVATPEMVYVVTNAGLMLAVNPARRAIEWAVMYEPPSNSVTRVAAANMGLSPNFATESPPFFDGRTLVFKEVSGPRVVSVDTMNQRVNWTRSVAVNDALVAVSPAGFQTLGAALSSYALASTKDTPPLLKWSSAGVMGAPRMNVAIAGGEFHMFSPRGVFRVNPSNGDFLPPPLRGRDMSSLGGVLHVVPPVGDKPGRVITVSNFNITAYPLKKP